MTVGDRPDDVLGTESRVTPKKYAFTGAHHGRLVDNRAIPFIEFDADVALYPRKRIVLADGEDYVVTGNRRFADHGAAVDAAVIVDLVLHQLEGHADKFAVVEHEFLGRVIDEDFDIFLFGILQLPVGCLEESPGLSSHHLDVGGAEAQ